MITKGKFYTVLFIISVLAFVAWAVVRISAANTFDEEVNGYLDNYKEAGTIEVAEQNLSLAIESLEEKGLTDGQVSIFLANPNNDIGLWYNNLLKSRELLKNTTDEKLLDQSIILKNQKSELVGSDSLGDLTVSHPDGISIYPHNQLFFWWCILSIAGMIGFGIRCVMLASNSEWDDPLIERKDNTVKA